jgi:DNA repair protein RadC
VENLAAARKTLWHCHKDLAGLLDPAGDDRGLPADSFPSPPPSSPAAADVQESSPVRAFRPDQTHGRLSALRRRVREQGAGSLQDAEVLELLLGRCGSIAGDASAVTAALLCRFGSIPRIIGATIPELALVAGDEVAVELALFHDLARQVLEFPMHKRSVLSSWSAVLAYLKLTLAGRSREAFHVLFLDKANQLIADERMGDGTIDHAPVYPREIMRRSLELAASACCLVHNHPTGSSTPSAADIEMTRRVVEAGKAVGVAIHDHFLVAGDEVVSFKALGLM